MRQHLLEMLTLAAALVISLVLAKLFGLPTAFTVLGGTALGALPWVYDRGRARADKGRSNRRTRETIQWLGVIVATRLPALQAAGQRPTVTPDKWAEDVSAAFLENRRADPADPMGAIQEMADFVLSRLCDRRLLEIVGPETLQVILLHLAADSLDPTYRAAARSLVRAFVGEQLVFGEGGTSLTETGQELVSALAFLRQHGRVEAWDVFHQALQRRIERSRAARVVSDVADPQLSYIVYGLGKAQDLSDLVRRKMSTRRVVSRLSGATGQERKGGGARYHTFLVLKQEWKLGNRYIKARMDSVRDRLVGSGWLYRKDKRVGYHHSVSVVTMPYASESAEAFFGRHFQGISDLPPEDRSRASLVTIPIDTSRAFYFPADISSLAEAQQAYYRGWSDLLRRDREIFQEVLVDFEISFLELVRVLTLDFLVRDLVPGEKKYLRDSTDAVMESLGAGSLLELAKANPNAVLAALRQRGYPPYDTADLRTFIDSYDRSLKDFFTGRLVELATAIVENARKLTSLAA